VQALQGAVLDPLILGREVELHPVILILAFLICGKILGFVGVLLAVPIASIGKILTQEFVMPSVAELAAEQQTTMIRRREAAQADTSDMDADSKD
jgi:predicted PurR-regulated permease PerM